MLSAGQEIVDLSPHFVVAAHTAAGFQRETIDARGQLVEWRCLGGNLTECLQPRHGPSGAREAERPDRLLMAPFGTFAGTLRL